MAATGVAKRAHVASMSTMRSSGAIGVAVAESQALLFSPARLSFGGHSVGDASRLKTQSRGEEALPGVSGGEAPQVPMISNPLRSAVVDALGKEGPAQVCLCVHGSARVTPVWMDGACLFVCVYCPDAAV